MKVAFLHARQAPTYADLMVASVKAAMPGVEVLQLTDLDTPTIDGCAARRATWDHDNPMIFRMQHLSQLTGDVLILDTDVIAQRDVSGVFSLPFDMALTWRDGPIWDEDGNDIVKIMPINCGVMFQRNPSFWDACLQWCSGKAVGWYADQIAVAHVWTQFDVLRLHCDQFNYTPYKAGDDVSRRYIVHYKGGSRKFLNARFGL
jgi:hypothetical protein